MRLTTLSDIARLLFIMALGAFLVSTTALGPFVMELSGSAYSEINRLMITEVKPPAKAELAGTTQYYKIVDGPDGRRLVPR